MAWLYVPGQVDSNLDSDSPSPDTVVFATSSGKASPRQLSWRGWKTRPWIERLSGTISRPSMAERGVESWISCLRASRASRSVRLGNSADSMTSDGSGLLSSNALGTFNPDGSFSKTCLDLFVTDSDPCSVDWPRSGTMRNGVCSARPTLELHTSGNASGVSPAEGTAWTTPAATETGQRTEKYAQGGTPLTMQAGLWATPDVRSHHAQGATHNPASQSTQIALQAQQWPTPNAHHKDAGPIPPREDGTERLDQLPRVAVVWPTPTSTDANGARNQTSGRKPDSTHNPGTTLNDAIRSSLPALRISSCGPECSPKHRRLNPRFVEWLMNWPAGWTDSGPAVTAYTRWRQQSLCWLSHIAPAGWTNYATGGACPPQRESERWRF